VLRSFLKSKIRRATVTQCELHYEGSCAIMAAGGCREKVQPHACSQREPLTDSL
jgi:aspartate 1-decarboxylase